MPLLVLLWRYQNVCVLTFGLMNNRKKVIKNVYYYADLGYIDPASYHQLLIYKTFSVYVSGKNANQVFKYPCHLSEDYTV